MVLLFEVQNCLTNILIDVLLGGSIDHAICSTVSHVSYLLRVLIQSETVNNRTRLRLWVSLSSSPQLNTYKKE